MAMQTRWIPGPTVQSGWEKVEALPCLFLQEEGAGFSVFACVPPQVG